MEHVSTYGRLGVPDAVASALVLISISLALAPWFGGVELGPLKVPRLEGRTSRVVRIFAPLILLVAIAGFYPLWPEARTQANGGAFSELELRWLEETLGASTWTEADTWGTVVFDKSGRAARYSNVPGRSPGGIELRDAEPGSGFILFRGDWRQDDGKTGELELLISGYGDKVAVMWGPRMSIVSELTKVNSH